MKITLGIDLGGMSAKAACLSDGKLIGYARTQTRASDPPEETARRLADLSVHAAAQAGVPFREICAVGIGSPGVVDSERGVVVAWTNFGWKNVHLASLVSQVLRKPVFVLNDANAAALGEARYGAGANYASSVLVTVGTGIGSGIIFEGKIFEGSHSAGGELGHTVIRTGGERCTCGRRGCFERYASASALIRMTEAAMEKDPSSQMRAFCGPDGKADGKTAFAAARAGDRSARNVIGRYIGFLADGIANLVNLIRPQAVILGGGISAEGEALLAPLRRKVKRRIYVPAAVAPLDVIPAALGNDAGIYGAACFAAERE